MKLLNELKNDYKWESLSKLEKTKTIAFATSFCLFPFLLCNIYLTIAGLASIALTYASLPEHLKTDE